MSIRRNYKGREYLSRPELSLVVVGKTVFHARTRSMALFRPIKKRESRPSGKRGRKIAAFLPMPLAAAGQHVATENLPTALQRIKSKIEPEGLTRLVAASR
jgi:hypothetical protein